ncbi:MAG: ABC transporter ATP-binding protein [Bacteroidota bacterium]|jgi:lipoprotein-releasing system ATP-binding protein|nr:ABC transporter ATP-binding protein [Bacteroidota bacterium]GIR21060.1 MAG: lipoprotein-releasing system ATP-binding protein LolD [Flavobacteriales bacterium]|tara:strand:+ start:138 stop:797 length:660 start_codon:yes stop_codon:yes gene_type:complete
MIVAENIHKFYENNHILKGINLRVDKGEIISLVGASGAGKTTLLQILGTIDKYDKKEGSKLLLKNQDISDFTENQLANFRNHELGFIFQFHQLLPEFNVIENICIPAFIKKTPKNIAESKANQLMNYLGISDRSKNKPNELSGGEKQRVAVARALINEPSIILADEPSGNLDSNASNNLHELFLSLRKDFNYTFIIATHNKLLAKKSDRVLEIKDGKIK